MKIILEGCDGAGKTTLAKKLADKYRLDIIHVTNKDPNDFEFYYQSLRKTNVIYDRNVIGETIYPSVFGRKQNIDRVDCEYLIRKAKASGAIILILTSDDEVIQERLLKRSNEDERIIGAIKQINAEFKSRAYEYSIPIIDTSKISFEEICEKYINKEKTDYDKL